MYAIKGVNATPGGRITVHFHDHGYAVKPDQREESLAETFLGEGAGCVTLLVMLASLGAFTLLRKSGAPEAAVDAAMWVFLVALCYGALIALLNWAGGVIAGIAIFLFAVVTFPALLIPGYRRALRRRRGGRRAPESEPGWVPAAALAGVWHQPDQRGAGVVTVQLTDGSVTAYVPAPERAHDLYARFDALLRSARPAPWHPGQPAQHQSWR
ncbi:hypothetical protein ACIRBY_05095 [Streptomyces sp. NPDC096136]|uniref:hypothetical protein n=1 Tax=Streptomyces sp. NPDC096136 TaxID=3366076 RepID=UPI003823BE20